MYKIGDVIRCKYQDAPIEKKNGYEIGQEIDISDNETGKKLAIYIVVATDDTYIDGKINSVAEPEKDGGTLL